ncbi:MAG: hypothetical protein MJ158_03945 [Alphaproteobacteria bacterium]|nr:hypothetical protein [Alphaproteobacteria bacterium]
MKKNIIKSFKWTIKSVLEPQQIQKTQMVHKKPIILQYIVTVDCKEVPPIDYVFANGNQQQMLKSAKIFYKKMLRIQNKQKQR